MSEGNPGIVTPEAVVLAFETAGVGSRMIATLVDLLIQAVLLVAAILAFAVLASTSVGLAGVLFSVFLILFAYPVILEGLWRGQTPGKAALGLRVVTVEGGQIGIRHAVVRGALDLVDLWATTGGAAIIAVVVTARNQRLGDLAAGTLVVRERRGAAAPPATEFAVPPGWEGYAAALDVSGLSAEDYQAARSFLLRAAQLDPHSRRRLAEQIATALLPRLHHRPPPGTPAEPFLACVAARYQQRQWTAAQPWRAAPAGPPPGPRPAPPAPSTRTVPGPEEPAGNEGAPPAPSGIESAPGNLQPGGGGFVAPS